jgi:hypothetical protein
VGFESPLWYRHAVIRAWTRISLVLAILFVASSCAPRQGEAQDANEAERQKAANHLLGQWLLVDYQPEVPLEPMLASLLSTQYGSMVIDFDGRNLNANGPGVTGVQRPYRVTQATFNRVTAIVYDQGLAYDVVGEFRGNEFWFVAQSSPWRGRGVLRRR